MTDITELAQRMSIERIKQIALGGTPTMGGRESLAITALHFAEELKIATDAFQAAGLAQLAAEEALERAQTKAIERGRTACELFDEVTALRQRIAELESRLNSADKLQDSAFRSGLQHGFSLGQTDDQKGYEQSMAAYSSHAGIKVEAE
ncbi:TPA: hypothetical protein MDH73_004637 [Klebsiella pneumoniae]|uniref:hypothetical protein n=1 Tax=Klebsiella pneumoniae complex TaxID=3390273 RepID=UPI000E2B0C29|nr:MULTISPECIES: hypothetical protein [Klebsiella]HDS4697801.1 hypothetical protein [Klebsiella pneumoniae subsp. pneumoniae]MBD7682342.1 hypothetical protein [Klebsiella pneumoniae]MBG1935213.1 hypothetical protein [Klebsiella pneumoniae]MCD9670701.1 hypothetical protein [Klebsiella variicola subsp. variicola]WLT59127.1 hypothetical protein P0934_07165 [Klebsiella pneumoniae]